MSDWLERAVAAAEADVQEHLEVVTGRGDLVAEFDTSPLARPDGMAEHLQRMTAEVLAQVPSGYRLASTSMRQDGDRYVLVCDWEPIE